MPPLISLRFLVQAEHDDFACKDFIINTLNRCDRNNRSSSAADEREGDKRKRSRHLYRRCDIASLLTFTHEYQHCDAYRQLVIDTIESNLINRLSLDRFSLDRTVIFVTFTINDCDIPAGRIDHQWCSAIQALAILRMQIEESLSWLSTLGGAFSSLGDRNLVFARRAAAVTRSQMLLATIFGDANLIARCFIYLAHSWCQQGFRRRAIALVRRRLFPHIAELHARNRCDRIVAQMYRSLRFRIMFIYK